MSGRRFARDGAAAEVRGLSERLVRAIARGGCAGRLSSGDWGVWRGSDRRTRKVGTLPAAEIDALIAMGHLKPLGADAGANALLAWSGPAIPLDKDAARTFPKGMQILFGTEQTRAMPLLWRVLVAQRSEANRKRLREATRAFAMDIEASGRLGAASTMNWESFQTGGRRAAFYAHEGRHGWRLYAVEAQRRLDAIRQMFGARDFELLRMIVVDQSTRHSIERRLELSAKATERYALRLLCQLADLFDEHPKAL